MGVENEETLCEMSSPPLTSMRLAGEQVGFEAAKLLDRLMRGGKAPRKPTLVEPRGIVARKSTDTVAVTDPLLSQAIRLIRERASSGLRVKDLLKKYRCRAAHWNAVAAAHWGDHRRLRSIACG